MTTVTRRRRWPLLLLLAAVALGGCDDDDHRDDHDVGCADREAQAEALLAGPAAACEADDDCVYVGGSHTCDCNAFYGPWAVNREHREAAEGVGEALLSGGCSESVCDAPKTESWGPTRCVAGRCALGPEATGCLPGSDPDFGPDLGPDAGPDAAPPERAGAFSTESMSTRPPEWYVEQALIYFDTLDVRADPDIVPDYAADVARWEWPPWLYLTGWGAQQMIATTRAALRIDPSTVEERDCRFFATQPFARCYVNFVYAGGDCPIYEEFTFNDAGEMTFLEAWSVLPGRMPVADYAADPWAEGADAARLSTRVPGLGSPDGAIVLDAPWMQAAAADDADVADFVRRASDFWTTWREAYDAAGGEAVYAIGCGWEMGPHDGGEGGEGGEDPPPDDPPAP